MNQEPDLGSLMPDTFSNLGNNSYGTAIDDYQAQMNDYNLRGPNAQFIESNANYDEEGTQRNCCARLAVALGKIKELEDAFAGLNGCSPLFFNDINNTIAGNVCVSSREDGKIDITWSLTSRSTLTKGGSNSGTYRIKGNIYNANGNVVGSVNSTNGPYCPYQRSSVETFILSANGTGVSGGVIPSTASYIDWYVAIYNDLAGRSYL